MKRFLLMALMAASVPAGAATVVNGSFEQGDDPGSFTTVNAGQTNIFGWDVLSGSVDYIGSYWQASEGARSIDLSGNSIGTIGQVITGLEAGKTYQLTFDVSRNPDGGEFTRTGLLSAGGEIFTFAYTDSRASHANMHWHTVSYQFTATGSTALVSFSSDASGGCCYGPALDNVRIAAVPEPATWALMLSGFGLVGLGARRRQVHVTYA